MQGLGMGPPGVGPPGIQAMGMFPPGMGPPGMFAPGMGPPDTGPSPGVDPGGPAPNAQGPGARLAASAGPGLGMRSGRDMAGRRGGGPGMPGMNQLTRPGAEEFFQAVRTNVALGDVIQMNDGAAANLITGATGRWTSSGILRDVRSENARARPEECDFVVVLGGGMGMPGPGGPMGFQALPSTFERVFENEYGTLYRNPARVQHDREPLQTDVSLPRLAVIALVGVFLVAIDVLFMRHRPVRFVAAAIGTIVVSLCLLPLARTAIGELRNPPSAPEWRGDGPPDLGPPDFVPLGPGAPRFGEPGFVQQRRDDSMPFGKQGR